MVADAVRAAGVPAIIHICGDVRPVEGLVAGLRCDALSFDAMVGLAAFKRAHPSIPVMGNISTYLLEFGDPGKIRSFAEGLIRQDVDIKAPACGLSTSTPLENIQAFTEAVKSSG